MADFASSLEVKHEAFFIVSSVASLSQFVHHLIYLDELRFLPVGVVGFGVYDREVISSTFLAFALALWLVFFRLSLLVVGSLLLSLPAAGTFRRTGLPG